MSLACVQNYLAGQFANFQPTNGECRLLAPPAPEATNSQGFIAHSTGDFTPRTVAFLPCSWAPVRADKASEDEVIADKTRSTAVYEVTLAASIAGVATVALPGDRLELRTRPGDSASGMICEIVRRVNNNNIAWILYAVNLDDNL